MLIAGGPVLGRGGVRRPLGGQALGLGAGHWFGVAVAGLQLVLLAMRLGLVVGLETDLPDVNVLMAAPGVGVAVFLIILNAFALGSVLNGPAVSMGCGWPGHGCSRWPSWCVPCSFGAPHDPPASP